MTAGGLLAGMGEMINFRTDDLPGPSLVSDCILNGTDPEPDGEEGFADMRVLEGVLAALKTGGSVTLPPFSRIKRIDTQAQKLELGSVSTPELVGASNPAKDTEKQPKN